MMQYVFKIQTDKKEGLYDITDQIVKICGQAKVDTGIISIYVKGATAAIMIQENWDQSVLNDVLGLLRKIAPPGIWEHDLQDNNGDAHLKAGLIGPSETIPIINGIPGLSRWQNIFVCDFDGPREQREIIVTIINTEKK